MPCHDIQSWTLKGLVAAFLDLAVAYLLLCASALVYLSSKFLSLFGLSLPCPCDGLFSSPDKNKCFQEILGNFPVKKISAVHGSVKNRIPFDSILFKDPNCRDTGEEKKGECGTAELVGETSSSIVPGQGSGNVAGVEEGSLDENVSGLGLLSSQSLKKGTYESKGKRFSAHRSFYGLRYRRKCGFGYEKFPKSPANVTKSVNDVKEKDSASVNSEEGGKALEDGFLRKSVSLILEPDAENKQPERTSSSVDLTFDGDAQNTIRILEQALEEERAAHIALSLELEKERNAAATAADEAMAMILRLQEEKASIEMEARQYQRMIEEKSAFDAEEMSILKEILLRREKEKHFLEREVETFRQMLLEIEQPGSCLPDAKAAQSEGMVFSYSVESPTQMLHPKIESFDERGNMETADFSAAPEVISNQIENCVLAFGNELGVPGSDDDGDYSKPGEVHQVLVDNSEEMKLHRLEETSEFNPSTSQGLQVHEKTITLIDGEPKEKDESNPFRESMSRASENRDPKTIVPCSDDKTENVGADSRDLDCRVHDIHVIADEDRMSNKVQVNVPIGYPKASDAINRLVTENLKLDRSRSVSDTTYGLPPICPPPRQLKTLSPDMRRKSMSALDSERLKIESEVGQLRGRLKAVQQGREKLGLSMGRHREQGKTQLQLLEDITSHLHEIKQLTESGRSVPQGSFRPVSSMVKLMSKKRRWRSATLDLHSA